ncbi:Glycoside hydrolase [Elaphomyces granulatus]
MGARSALIALIALLGSSAVIAIPTQSSSYEYGYGSCTFTGSTGAASAIASKSSCSTITLNNVAVPTGKTLDLPKLGQGAIVTFEGETTFGYSEWEGPLILISGSGITVTGASGSVINGDGGRWWDGKGGNGGKKKPRFFAAHRLNSSTITGITIKNSPVQIFSIDDSTDLTLSQITIDNSAGDSTGAHNTDAFDIGQSTGVTITGAKVYNQDDCIAINSGKNILVNDSYCHGGHGLSIGSVGGRDDNVVSNVTFSNSQVVNSQNGIRIKPIYDNTGSIDDITYKNITITGITKYGIVIRQDYTSTGEYSGNPTDGIPITNVTLSKINGSLSNSATEISIGCCQGSCSEWTCIWDSVAISGGKTSTQCLGLPSGIKC